MSSVELQGPAGLARRPGRIALAALGALVVALPFLLYLVTLPRYGTLARNDYFGDLLTIRDGDHLSHQPARWLLARSNEHRITLPLLVWTANIALTHGDNRAISAFSLALLVATFCLILFWLPPELRRAPLWLWPAAATLAALVVTPMAAHNWVLGFSGTQWFLANLSAVAALGLAVFARPEDGERRIAWAVVAGTLGAFAHSTHLALWPALALALALVPGPRRRWLWVAAGATAVYALYALTYRVPSGHPQPSAEPLGVARFALLYLGALVSEDQTACLVAGVVAVVAGGFAIWLTLRERDRERRRVHAAFLGLAVYAFFNAVGSAVARVGFGFGMALSSRYASLPALYWMGVLGVLGVAAWENAGARRRSAAGAALLALALALVAPMESAGLARLRSQLARAAAEPLPELALQWGVWDAPALRIVGAGRSQGVRAGVALQRALGHVPFDRPDPWPPGSRLPPATGAEPPYEGLRIEGAAASSDRAYVSVRGARRGGATGAPPSRVLLVDGEGVIRGGLVPTHLPNESATLLGRTPPATLWRGFLQRSAARGGLTAWAVFGSALRPIPLTPRLLRQFEALQEAPVEPAAPDEAAEPTDPADPSEPG